MSRIDEIAREAMAKDRERLGIEYSPPIGYFLTERAFIEADDHNGFSIGQLVHTLGSRDMKALTMADLTGSPYRASESRWDCNLEGVLVGKEENAIILNNPIVASNMECVTPPYLGKLMENDGGLAVMLPRMGGIAVINQFCEPSVQADIVNLVKKTEVYGIEIQGKVISPAVDNAGNLLVAAAIGTQASDVERVKYLIDAGADVIVIDNAHGHSERMVRTIEAIKKNYDCPPVIAGNIVSPKPAVVLAEAGVDGYKVNIGPGDACTIRRTTGFGLPVIDSVYRVGVIARHYGLTVMADGGMKSSGDMIKALAAGANTLMLGTLLGATSHSSGFKDRLVEKDSQYFLKFWGSASEHGKQNQGRYIWDAPEGRSTILNYAGTTEVALMHWYAGMLSGLSYSGRGQQLNEGGRPSIERLQRRSRWKLQSQFGHVEGYKQI